MVATAFELPEIEDGDEVELAAWLVEVGDSVTEGQPIAEVETEKSVIEIEAPFDGTVSELLVEEWTTVNVGEEIAVFEVEEAALDGETEATDDAPADAEDSAETDAEEPPGIDSPEGRVFAPPRVRRLARELGVDIASVEGTDEHGRISEQDVREAAEADTDDSESDESGPKPFSPSGKSAVSKGGEKVSGAGLSKTSTDTSPKPVTPSGKSAISKRDEPTGGAQATGGDASAGAQFAAYDTATVDRVVDLTETLEADTRAAGVELGPLAVIVKALSRTVTEAEIGVDDIHVGIGMRTNNGLVVPTVRDVGEKTLLAVAEETAEQIKEVDAGEFDAGEHGEPTVVVTEPGALGDGYSTPPLGGASIAIGLGALEPRPVVEAGTVVAHETLPVSLVVDGDVVSPTNGAAVLTRLLAFLEEPNRLLLKSK